MRNILDCSHEEIQSFLSEAGEPAYRAGQIRQWLWQKGCTSFADMTNLSKKLRTLLSDQFTIVWPEVDTRQTSSDGTVKFLLRLADKTLIETVLIPEKSHYTQCLSSQVGCPLACTFCSTGDLGFTRNLSPGEILGQVLVARDHLLQSGSDLSLRNIVFMGMGEPMLNWPAVRQSLETLGDETAFGFSHRRITVSTVGVPGMLGALGESGLAALAVSLHAPSQELRARIMPRAARFPLDELLSEMEGYPLAHRERITIEYVLLGGVNDGLDQARALVRILSRIKCKVNLIAFNPGPGINYAAPDPQRVLDFVDLLHGKGLTATLRKSKGQDIAAACGQLRAQCDQAKEDSGTDLPAGPSC